MTGGLAGGCEGMRVIYTTHPAPDPIKTLRSGEPVVGRFEQT
jgi:hypothetical protein